LPNVYLTLSMPQAEYLKDILENWLEDYDEAHKELVESPSACYDDDVEEYVAAVERSTGNRVEAEAIKAMLEMELR
jgi:hypothetical protein